MSPEITAHKNEVRSEFDALAFEYLKERDRQYFFLAQKSIVLQMVDHGPGRLLDVGCGPAVMAGDLLARGFDYWGIDASANMIRLGREKLDDHPNAARCQLDIGDAEHLAFADGSFDCLISMGVLEYLISYPPAIGEMYRVLRPGGTAVISLPQRACAYHYALGVFNLARTMAGRPAERFYVNRCIPRTLSKELQAQGFQILESRICKFIFFPLHELHEGASRALDRVLSRLSWTKNSQLLGTQYIVKLKKPQK
jgi:ubiquinone/menaquinone biosynthesis C-methylase UbiE